MMELLAPAGGREALIAAVQNGADAVYLGAGAFNARRSADNFEGDGLKWAVDYCHARGVGVHVTVNTMVRQEELPLLEKTVAEIYESGADAFIVQDLGVAEICRAVAPGMVLHASTQMAVHNAAGVEYLARRGFARVVLAREMEFEEIRRCAGLGAELEAFVHGALCVSCSGQCLMSSMIGGRSGNRGQCAQPCRLPYRVENQTGYRLSPRDLMGLPLLESYRQAGVDSLKVEGRLKRPEYVAVVTRAYRRALDGQTPGPEDVEELKQIFNRGGFTQGYGPGVEERTFLSPERPNHAGVKVGACQKKGAVRLAWDVESGDALALQGAGEDRPVKLAGKAGEQVRCPEALPGDALVRTVSRRQMAQARQSWEEEHRATPVSAEMTLRVGQPVQLRLTCGELSVLRQGGPVQIARGKPLDENRVKAQLQKTGGTPFEMREIRLDADANAFCAVSELNELRRGALAELEEKRRPAPRKPGKPGPCPMLPGRIPKTLLRAQSGDVSALKLALANGADQAIFAPRDLRKLDDALQLERFFLMPPQVMRQEELERLHQWAAAHQERILGTHITNIGQLNFSWPGMRLAGFSMNIANNRALAELNPAEYAPSVELTARQIGQLGGAKELVVYGRLPLMQLRHCPRRAAENLPGKHRDCRLCDVPGKGDLPCLIDRTGAAFPLMRMAYASGCVLQLLNSVPLMLLRHVEKLPSAAAWRMLVEKDDAAEAARLHRLALDGRDFRKDPAWAQWDARATTTGHYFRGVE